MKHLKLFFAILIPLGTMGQIASDLYLPSLPHIVSALGTTNNLAQLSVAFYMAGFTIAQLIYGPLSDAVGRRFPLLVGLTLFLIASIICAASQNITWLIVGRLLQGLGAGAAVSLSRAILRDVFSHEQLAKYMSYMSIGAVSLMASAPMFGGYFQHFFGWRFSFYFLLIYGAIMLLCVFIFIEETNQYKNMSNVKLSILCNNIKTLLTTPIFIGSALITSLSYSGLIAWLTAGPMVMQDILDFSPVAFGWMAFAVASSYCITAYVNSRAVSRYQFDTLIRFGLHIMFVSSLLMVMLYNFGLLNIYVIIVPLVFYGMSTAFTFVNCFAQAFQPFPKIAGISTAVYSFIQIGGGFISASVMSYFNEVDQLPLATWLLAASVSCLLINRLMRR